MTLRRTLIAFLLLTLPLAAQAPSFKVWKDRLEARGVKVSAGLWDLSTGRLLEGHQTGMALTPASTTKVVSTYAMLKTWKPDFELSTEVLGDLQNGVVRGDLVFKGGGDPFFTRERIWMLAQELKAKGVQRVTGKVRLDQSAFDHQRYGVGWENTSADTTPPVLPLAVNFNRDDRGRILHDPEPFAVALIGKILAEAGIAVEGGASEAAAPPRLMAFPSPPLRQLVQDINKFSNNFMTEMLVKRFGEGSWAGGISRIQAFYKATLELDKDAIAITDGSGLSKENRLSARTLAIVLRAAWNDFEVGPEFVSSLKIIGGEPWKLRVKDDNLARRIRCKTGHLTGVSSVCGYLQMPDGQLRVFVILLNGNCRTEDLWEMVSRWAN
ncbi:MAG: D-alanyl-D-alanine carboxypeptidase [Firmicutes bacterium]|nr:D-alanyl-D-alanine carboxypeptidase [Bacillota bacterium]